MLCNLVSERSHQRLGLVLIRESCLEEEGRDDQMGSFRPLQQLFRETLHDGALPMTRWTSEHEKFDILPRALARRPPPQVVQDFGPRLVKAAGGICSFLRV